MNRSLLNQIERVVLLFVLYALAGVAGSSVAYRLLQLGRTGPDYGPLVLSIGLLVVLVGCIVSVRGRENPPLFPLPPWVPGPGTTLLILGLLPVIASLFRPGAGGTGEPVAAASAPRDTIVSILPAPAATVAPQSDTGRAPLDGAPAVVESPSSRIPAVAAGMVPRPRAIFTPYDADAGGPGSGTPVYTPSARFEPASRSMPTVAMSSDLAWAERLRHRVLRDNYAPSSAEMSRYRRVRDSLQRTTGNLSLGATGGVLAAPAPAQTPQRDPFEEVPIDVPAGAPVRGSFGTGADSTAP